MNDIPSLKRVLVDFLLAWWFIPICLIIVAFFIMFGKKPPRWLRGSVRWVTDIN